MTLTTEETIVLRDLLIEEEQFLLDVIDFIPEDPRPKEELEIVRKLLGKLR